MTNEVIKVAWSLPVFELETLNVLAKKTKNIYIWKNIMETGRRISLRQKEMKTWGKHFFFEAVRNVNKKNKA